MRLERLLQDMRYAGRLLRKSPGFAATAILSMALGIGANTAIFSLIDAVLLKSLPVRNPGELIAVGNPTRTGGVSQGPGRPDIFAYPFYERFRERNQVFTDVYATGRSERLEVTAVNQSASTGAKQQQTRGRFVTGNYFSVLGVSALLGRTFGDEEVRVAAAAPVVVISYEYWSRQFASDPAAIGQTLLVNGSRFTVIGVMPPEFFGDVVGIPVDMWFPITMQPQANPGRDYLKDRNVSWLLLMGRLKSGVSIAQAAAAVNVLAPQIFGELYKTDMPRAAFKRLLKDRIEVTSGAKGFSRIRHEFSLPLLILMGIVLLLLLICCANVANLQLARAAGRGREMGLRLAVGAGRARLIYQLLTESLMLSLLGGAVALLFAMWGSRLLLQLVSTDERLPFEPHLDIAALVFTAVITVLAGLLFGLAPALHASRVDLVSTLRESKSGQSERLAQRFGKALIIAQIVFSLMLLVAAGLFIRTLRNLENLDVGYRRSGLVLVEVDPRAAGYKDNQVNARTVQLLDRLRAIPGVQAVTVSENGLFSGTDSGVENDIEGYTPSSYADRQNRLDRVGPGYFEVVGTPVLMGRGIESRDTATGPKVAVINAKMANFYFPHSNPLGRHIFDGSGPNRVAITIVGVVRDAKERDLREPPARRFYTAYLQHSADDPIEAINLEIRTRIAPAAIIGPIRREIHGFDPNLPIVNVETASDLIGETLVQEKLIAKLSSLFGVIALLLAAIGLYGVMSYITARRTMEIGIRMALGAARSTVISMVLRETFALLGIGLIIGTAASVFTTKLFTKSLYGLSRFDPLTIISAGAVIAIAAVLATYFPARRASRIDPMDALRHE